MTFTALRLDDDVYKSVLSKIYPHLLHFSRLIRHVDELRRVENPILICFVCFNQPFVMSQRSLFSYNALGLVWVLSCICPMLNRWNVAFVGS